MDHTINAIEGWSFSQTKPKDGSAPKPFFRIDFMINGQKQSARQYYSGNRNELAAFFAELGLGNPLAQLSIRIKEQQSGAMNPKTGLPYVNFYVQTQAGIDLYKASQAQQPAPSMAPPQQPAPQAAPAYTPQGGGEQLPGLPPQQDSMPF